MRILLFNFFAGVLRRGIPLYVENLSAALESSGIKCFELRCPKWLATLPRPIVNVLFVLTEQFIVPIVGLAFDRTIYPYNSVAILAGFSSRTSVVVHDLIPNHTRDRRLAARYIRATQRIYARLGGHVIYSSAGTMRLGQRIHQFPLSSQFLFPNTFYRFVSLRAEVPPQREEFVLLCSGWGRHKDLRGALRLYRESGLYQMRPLRILGLAGHTREVDTFCEQHPEIANRITIYPQLPDPAVVTAYETAAWIWIHSLREGSGRSLAEARLCGGRVLATSIPPFREQQDSSTFLYSGREEFSRAIENCEARAANASRRIHFEHDHLRAEIERYLLAK